MNRLPFRSQYPRPAFRLFLALTAVFVFATTAVRAQAPIGQSSFAQYLATLTVGAGTLGATAGYTGDGFAATAATLNTPESVAYDSAGNLYIADNGANVIRRVDVNTGIITTYAGNGSAGTAKGTNGDGGLATAANLNTPIGIYFDAAGDLFIDDNGDSRIREVSAASPHIISTAVNSTGVVTIQTAEGTTWAGTQLSAPNGFGMNAEGDLLIGDSGANHYIARIAAVANMLVFTEAGSRGVNTDTGDGGPATSATFGGPRNFISDPKGEYFIIDKTHDRLRLITLDGIIHGYGGISATATYTGDGGPATSATLNNDSNGAADAFGNLFVADQGNNVIRVVDRSTGNISTVSFLNSGTINAGTLSGEQGFVFGPSGQFAIADTANHVVRIGNLNSNFAPTAVSGTSASTSFTLQANGTTSETISAPVITPNSPGDFTLGTLAGIPAGTCPLPILTVLGTAYDCTLPVTFTPTAPGLRVAQVITQNQAGAKAILPLTGIGTSGAVNFPNGLITTFAGTAGTAGTIVNPQGMAFDAVGNLYFANGDNTVRMISPAGKVSAPVAGTGTAGFIGSGATSEISNATGGLATTATLSNPTAVALDPSGNLFIADTGNNVIREVSAENGTIDTITFVNYNGNLLATPSGPLTTPVTILKSPMGVATDSIGNIYIADTGNNVVRKLVRGTGIFSILAGTVGTSGYGGDNGAATSATLSGPTGLFVDSSNNVYIADTGNNVVRKISAATGSITTVAGSGSGATLSGPSQIALDAAGNLYIASASSNVVRVVSTSGLTTTVAGTGTASFSADGLAGPTSALSAPHGLALDQFGNVYIGDTGNARIAKLNQTTYTVSFGSVQQGTSGSTVTATVQNFGNAALSFSGFSTTAGFAVTTGTGNDCSTSTPLAAGSSCLVGMIFTPFTVGTVTGTLTITDAALNKAGSTQTVSLTGIGSSAPGSIVAVSGGAQTAHPYQTYASVLTVLVKSLQGTVIGGVPVTFSVPTSGMTGNFGGATSYTIKTDQNGNASATLTAGATTGSFTVTASVSGVSPSATFTETIAGSPQPAVTLTALPALNPITYGTQLTLTANVAPPGGLTTFPTGSVVITDGTSTVATLTLTGKSNTIATTLTPAAGTHSYAATYAGDSNYANASSTAVPLTVNPLAITAAANSVSLPFGAPVPTLTGTLTGVLTADVANVTVTYTANDPTTGAGILAGTGVGIYSIHTTLSGSAAANYTVASTSGSVTITQASTTSVLTLAYNNVGPNTAIPLTVVVAPQYTAATLTGTISFYDTSNANALLGTVSGSKTPFTVTLSPTTLALGTHVIVAIYNGDKNNAASTTNTVTVFVVNPDFSFGTSTLATTTVIQGQVGVVPFNVAAMGSLTAQIVFSCAGLPANTTCVFTPPSFTAPAPSATAVTSTVGAISVYTSGPGYQAMLKPSSSGRDEMLLAGLFGLPALVVAGLRRRRKAWMIRGLMMLVVACGIASLSGCGGNTSAPLVANYTPLGTTTITVTGVVPTVPSITHTVTFQLSVISKP